MSEGLIRPQPLWKKSAPAVVHSEITLEFEAPKIDPRQTPSLKLKFKGQGRRRKTESLVKAPSWVKEPEVPVLVSVADSPTMEIRLKGRHRQGGAKVRLVSRIAQLLHIKQKVEA